jgi:superfamily II DNA or RNA helicase
VGYFTSTSLAQYARGIEEFAERGGTMRLVASPRLEESDITDIERGYELREVIERALLRELDDEELGGKIQQGLGLVGRMVAQKRLDIKLAFLQRGNKIGLYHEKIGIFRDGLGDIVAFTGSSNETVGGLVVNFESAEVYLGWLPGDGARALRIEADFEDLWFDRTPHLTVEEFPDVARERLAEVARRYPHAHVEATDYALEDVDTDHNARGTLAIPPSLVVRDYQRQAIEAWLHNQGRGILAMATGTGKTKTAIVAAAQLSSVLQRREERLVIVVLAPYQHLVDQWIGEFAEFGIRALAIYEASDQWIPKAEAQMIEVHLGQRDVVTFVATLASFRGVRFQSLLSRLSEPLLLIADEAHNLGSPAYQATLPANATYRLALSATPERWFDPDGTEALKAYFGPIVYELGLGKAIEMGALCRYHYFPRLVQLDAEETQLYVDLTNQIAQRMSLGEDVSDPAEDSVVGQLLRRRAGVLGHAGGKLELLRADLLSRCDAWYQLVYCAEGTRPALPGQPKGPNQVAAVLELLGHQLHLAAHAYVAETPRAERRMLLRRFDSGHDLRFLVSMRCLDEGVDIPDARVGYLLASSSNPRQFIQRRGRLLRRAEGKERAEIFDYIAVPDPSAEVNFEVERKLLARELERANEFGKLADNYEATLDLLRPLKEKYQLMHL